MLPIILMSVLTGTNLPMGTAPKPVAVPHFPDRVHAFVWRNWQLTPAERMAEVIGATADDVVRMGHAMGLAGPPPITPEQQRRSYITVIRRNWHLLPYEQMLPLLDFTEEEMAYTLREDDFLFIKLGSLKPDCEPLKYTPPDDAVLAREKAIAEVVHKTFGEEAGLLDEDLFAFVAKLSEPLAEPVTPIESGFSPRYCYSYFALYGDPLLDEECDPFPDGYLARLAATGVSGVWLQAVLYKLAEFPWKPELSENYEKRLDNLKALVARARKHGMGIYLYLNEPRAMPLAFFEKYPDLKGVVEGDHAAMCTSAPEVQAFITGAVASICKAVPDLEGFFTITGSENLTNCWSHYQGANCPRCSKRSPAEVIAEVNALVQKGIDQAGTDAQLIAWDWGWRDDFAIDAINALPPSVAHMSVSEWSIPITRGGVDSVVGEYSISTIGPGPRATKHWAAARKRGLKTLAKIQANNTWELSAVPYVPAVANVAQHAANLREANVDGLMLSWTLGGCPSPNLEVVAEIGKIPPQGQPPLTVDQALANVAARRFSERLAPAVVACWQTCSRAFSEFPFHGGMLYFTPVQMGPANPFWEAATGYTSTMVGIPYDDLDRWRAVYPQEVFVGQFTKMADGFDEAIAGLKSAIPDDVTPAERTALEDELRVTEAAAIHLRSVANQAAFVEARRQLEAADNAEAARPPLEALDQALRNGIDLAKRLYAIQTVDSRMGFEASNHYYYVPVDLVEKAVNCQDLLDRWLPEQRKRFGL